MTTGLLTKWHEWASPQELVAFYDDNDSSVLYSISDRIQQAGGYPEWDGLEAPSFYESMGMPTAVEVAPGVWMTMLACFDNGAWKRDPALIAQHSALYAAGRLSFMVAVDAAIVANKGHSQADVLHVNARILERLSELGLDAELQKCCDELRRLVTALKSLQVSAAPKVDSDPSQPQREPIAKAMYVLSSLCKYDQVQSPCGHRQRVGTAYQLEGTIGSAERVRQVLKWTQEARSLYEEGNFSRPQLRLVLEDHLPGTLEWAEQASLLICSGVC